MPADSEVDVWLYPVAAAAGYVLGSIPFGLVLTRLTGGADPRRTGSGNIGATNVLRTGSRPLAAATLVLDAGKGAAAVLLLTLVDGTTGLLAGFFAGMALVGMGSVSIAMIQKSVSVLLF